MAAYVVVVGAFVALVVAALCSTGGLSVYSLDDSYIHLAMSEEIARGGYGVNTGEWAAASSSILFPVLLAPAAGFWWHEFVPLGINLVALLCSVHVFWKYLKHLGLQEGRAGQLFCGLLVAWCVIALNVVPLALTGLEHNLHVLSTLAVLYGVVVFLDYGAIRWWLVLAIIVGPLVRYEAAAVSFAALAVIALRRRLRLAAVLLAVVIGSLGAFSWMLLQAGLGPLPSSVLVKLSLGDPVGEPLRFLADVVRRVSHSINSQTRPGILLGAACTAAVIALGFSLRGGRRARIWFLLFYSSTIAAHLAVGDYGWFHRYEIYVIVFAVAGALYICRDQIAALQKDRHPALVALMVLASVGFVGGPYIMAMHDVPRACQNVYEQHFQMHRFVCEFHVGPVAVNDLGWVSYRNPDYVLDLWGLGSERVRGLRVGGLTPAEVDMLAKEHEVGLAMLYEHSLADSIPAQWIRVGRMHLAGQRVSVGSEHVEFFATAADGAARIRGELRDFQATLPAGVRLEIFE